MIQIHYFLTLNIPPSDPLFILSVKAFFHFLELCFYWAQQAIISASFHLYRKFTLGGPVRNFCVLAKQVNLLLIFMLYAS